MADAPGVTATINERPSRSTYEIDTGTAFMVGSSLKGPHLVSLPSRNLDQWIEQYGEREATGMIYDSVEAFFREGGSKLYFGRIIGPAPVAASRQITDGTVNTIRAYARDYGSYGLSIDLEVVTGAGAAYWVNVKYKGEVVESSPHFTTKAGLLAWANPSPEVAGSAWIRVDDLGVGGNPAAGTYALAGAATDDRVNATGTNTNDALDLFQKDFGPGQVLAPGKTASTSIALLGAHAYENNRVVVCDLPDSATRSTVTDASIALRSDPNSRFLFPVASWGMIPALVPGGVPRVVPGSPVWAGMMARNDSNGHNPNVAAAGNLGVSNCLVALTQAEWNEADRGILNANGANIFRTMFGTIRGYSFRSAAHPTLDTEWLQFSASREVMALAARGAAALEAVEFGQIDGKGVKLAEAEGLIRAICLDDYVAGALFGETPEEAFDVDVGPAVNPPEQLAQGIIKVQAMVRVSPFAERVLLEIVKVPTTEAI